MSSIHTIPEKLPQQSVNFFCSWSGGKDACLALYKMSLEKHQPQGLLTMMNESGELSRAHHLPKSIIEQQAKAMDLPLLAQATAKAEYKQNYLQALEHFKQLGMSHIVLGDIDLQAHRDWQEEQGQSVCVKPLFPLWCQDHKQLVLEFVEVGFEATIISILPDKVPAKFLGQVFNLDTIHELEALDIDVCAEGGEFHTVVTNGPLFSQAVDLQIDQATLCTEGEYGYHYLDLSNQ
ncbi:MAG: diphthine-ammonia ligase [Thiomicrorhabdus sp.]|nr:MAG: diphthine-ammonia ligase [Thiomicrorhabdus sp.]